MYTIYFHTHSESHPGQPDGPCPFGLLENYMMRVFTPISTFLGATYIKGVYQKQSTQNVTQLPTAITWKGFVQFTRILVGES